MKKKNILKTIVMLFSLGIIGGQENLSGQEDDDIVETIDLAEFIIDGGIAASQQQSLEIKRGSSNFVDAISAEGLGRFPDENVAESLQRITGVQINRNRGEGTTVNIRGLPSGFTHVLYNGRTLSSSITSHPGVAADRSFDFTSLPSEFVSKLRVLKTPTADLEEGGLSGTVDVETISAFDIGKRVIAASAQGAWESNSGKISPRASLLFSDVFAEGKVGFSFGLAYTKREPESHVATTGLGNRSESQGQQSSGGPVDFNGDGVIDSDLVVRLPSSQYFNILPETRERRSAIAKLEFQPSDNIDLFVEAFNSKQDILAIDYTNLHRFINGQGVEGATSTVEALSDANATRNYGTRVDGIGIDVRGGSRVEDRVGEILSLSAGGEYRGDSWTVSTEVSASDSTQLGSNMNIAPIGRWNVLFDSTLSSDVGSLVYKDGGEQAALDPKTFQVASLNGGWKRRNNDDLFDARLDFKKDTGWDVLDAIKFGVKFSTREQNHSNGRLVVGSAPLSTLVGGLPEGPRPGTFSAAPFIQLVEPSNGAFLGAFGGHNVFPKTFLATDTIGFLEQYTDDQLLDAGNYSNKVTGIIDVEEEVLAGYGMLEFESSDSLFSGNIGLRVVKTDQFSRGNTPDITKITWEPEAGAVTTIPPGEDVAINRSYTDFLPSANLRMNVSDDVIVRFAASRTMARPSLAQITPTASANGNSQTITRQNPLLDPFRSNNFDLGTEWYIGDSGLISVTVFYKDIVSLIRNDTSIVNLPIIVLLSDGSKSIENREFTINEPVNGEGVTLSGYEVSYQQPLDFLPIEGFGVLANYTFIDNSDPEQLTAASKNNFNLSGYYEKNRVAFRLSYTWRDGFLTNPGTLTSDGYMAQPFGVLDGNLTFDVNERFSLVVEAINILDEATISRTLVNLPHRYFDTGRRILFGVKSRF